MLRTKIPTLVVAGALTWLVILPLIFIVAAGFGLLDDHFPRTLDKLFSDGALPKILLNTLWVAVCVAVACTVLGSILALALERTRIGSAWLVDKLILVPIMVSPLVGTVAWITLGRPGTGFLNTFWRFATGADGPLLNIYSFTGIVLVMTLHFIPYVYLNVRNALSNIDGSTEEAAMVLGARTFRIWTRITLPLTLPAMLSSTLLVFVLAIETFSIAGLLGGPAKFITLPFNIYLTVHLPPGDWNYAALQGVLLIILTATLMATYWLIVGTGGKYSTVGGKGFMAATKVGGWVSHSLGSIAWIYIVIAVVIPMLALGLQSLLSFATNNFGDMVFTAGNWSRLLSATAFQQAFKNTIIIGAMAATLATIIALFVAQLAVFERVRSVDWLATLPLAFPGIVLGLALVFIYSGTPLYGGWMIMVLGFTTQFLPFATRALSGPMTQLDRGLDEAGKTLGAHTLSRVARLTAPMLRGPLVGAWILTFTRSFRELNIPIFLATPATSVVALLLWTYMEFGQTGLAAALSLLQIVVLIILISVAERVSRAMTVAWDKG